MLPFDLTPLATRLGCLPALEAASGKDLSRVKLRFLGLVLRAMPKEPPKVQAVIDLGIDGMDRLASGEDWPEAARATMAAAEALRAKSTALATETSDAALRAALWAAPLSTAAETAFWANEAGLPYDRQREILLRLMEEAPPQKGPTDD